MKTRLFIFIATLLILPAIALSLAGQEWTPAAPIAGKLLQPALLTLLVLLASGLLFDTLAFRRNKNSLLRTQRGYLLWSCVAGAISGAAFAYLNFFAATWSTAAESPTEALLLAMLCGGIALPAILVTRLWLAGFPGAVRLSTRRSAMPALPAEVTVKSLLFAALTGLLLGTIHIEHLGWLFWLSPLLLLVALQLLWHESTVFSGLAQGDWSRVLLGAVSGIIVGNIALGTFRMLGGALYFETPTWQLIVYFAAFGLLCLQLGDIVAENWRGKSRGEVFPKKTFPIITRKDQ